MTKSAVAFWEIYHILKSLFFSMAVAPWAAVSLHTPRYRPAICIRVLYAYLSTFVGHSFLSEKLFESNSFCGYNFDALLYIRYTREVHSAQPCVCATWHIQSTEGHDFRQSISQTTITYTHLHPPTCCCCYGLIRKSLPFSLCSNSANSSVTKLKSAHKIGTTVVFGAPKTTIQISIAIGHTIAHVLVLFSSFYCCVASVFLYVFFLGFSLFVTSMKKRVTAMTQSQSAVWTELRLVHIHSQTTRWVNISSMCASERVCVCVWVYLH